MANVAFVIVPEYTRTMPHLGIAYMRSMAALHGHQTRYFDFSAYYRTEKIFSALLKTWTSTFAKTTSMETFFTFLPAIIHYFEPAKEQSMSEKTLRLFIKAETAKMADKVMEFHPKTVCFSIYNTTLFLSLSVAQELKARKSDIKIIFGGPFLNDERTQEFILLFKEFVDHIVVGEGEYVVNDLIENNISPEQRILCTEAIQTLDSLPFPVFEGCDFAIYSRVMAIEKNWRGLAAANEKILPVMALRGCPYNCAFCDHHVVWKEYRGRSVHNVIEEIIHHQKTYDCRIFRFNDSLLNSNPKWLAEFCETLLDKNITIYWYGHCRADKLDKRLANLMYKAGCRYIKFGIESGSEHELKLMNKRITPETARQAIHAAYDAGIKVRASFIYAYPGETYDDLTQTVQFMEEIAAALYGVRMYYFMFMPGTPMEVQAEDQDITLNYFDMPNSKFTNVLKNIPETWSHPEINEEEIKKRSHIVQPLIKILNNDNFNYIPYMFSDAIKSKLHSQSHLMFQKTAIAKVQETDNQISTHVMIFSLSGTTITLPKELFALIQEKQNFHYKELIGQVMQIGKIEQNTSEELIIALISTGILQIMNAIP